MKWIPQTLRSAFCRGLSRWPGWRFVEFAGGAVCVLTMSLAAPTYGADGTWTNPTSGGLWSNTANWSGGIVADGSGFTANFNALDIVDTNIVQLDSTRTIGNLVFGDLSTGSGGSWVIDNNGVAGNVLTMSGGTPTITVNALAPGQTVTINASIAGGNIYKQQSGTLTLTGVNTFTGGFYLGTSNVIPGISGSGSIVNLNASGGNAISGNLLQIGSGNYVDGGVVNLLAANQINDAAIVSLRLGHYSGPAMFQLNGFNETIGGLTGNQAGGGGNLAVVQNGAATAATLTINVTSGTQTFGTGETGRNRLRIQDGGTGALNIVKSGAGTQIFGPPTGSPLRTWITYTGTTSVTGGTLLLRDNLGFASDVTISSGATFEFQNNTASVMTFNPDISGAGTLRKTGTGTIQVFGALSHTGNTEIVAGTLQLSHSGSQTLTGVISGAGSLVKDGVGTLTFAGANANTYTGGTSVNGGKLVVDFSNSTPTTNMISSASALTLGGGSLEIKGKAGIANSQSFASTTLAANSSSTFTVNQNGAASVIVNLGAITNNVGAMVNFVTAGSASDQVRTSTGTANTALGNWAIINGGDLAAKDATNTYIVALSTYNQNVPVLGGTISNVATDNVKIVDPGSTSGNITLAGATTTTINSLVHGATVNAGTIATASKTLVIDNAASGAIGNVLMGAGTSALTIGAASNDGFLTAGSAGAATLLLSNESANNLTINARIANNAGGGIVSVMKQGAGTVVFGAANTYTGSTTIDGGTLRTNAATNALGVGSVVTLNNSASLNLNGFSQTIGSLASPSTTTIITSPTPATLTTGSANTSTTYSGSFTGAVGLTQKGTGYLTLDGTVSNNSTGTLIVSAGNNSGTSGVRFNKTGGAVAWTGTVQMGDNTATQGNLKMSSSDQFGAGTVMNFSNTSGNWMRFDLLGTNQTLAGINGGNATTQAGAVIQNQGLDNVDAVNNAVLTLNGSGTYLYNGYFRDQDNGGTTRKLSLVKEGSGTQTFAGTQIYHSGSTTVNDGMLTLQNVSTSGTGNWNSEITSNTSAANTGVKFLATGNNALSIGRGTPTVAGSLHGSGNYYVDGDGSGTIYQNRVVLRGTSSDNTGTIYVINGGKLWVDRAVNAIGDASTVDLGSNARFYIYQGISETIGGLSGSGNVYGGDGAGISALTVGGGDVSATFFGVIQNNSSTLTLTKIGDGTQTLRGANIYSGVTTVSGGTLELGAGGSMANTSQIDVGTVGNGSDDRLHLNNPTHSLATNLGTSNVRVGISEAGLVDTDSGQYNIVGNLDVGVGATGTTTVDNARLDIDGRLRIGGIATGGTPSAGGTVTIGTGGAVQVNGNTTIIDSTTTALLDVNGGTFTEAGGQVRVGDTAGGTGTFTIQNGGVATIAATGSQLVVGNDIGSSGFVNISQSGSSLTLLGGDAWIGNNGTGTVTHTGGTVNIGTLATPRNIELGRSDANAIGLYSMNEATGAAVLNVYGDMTIGNNVSNTGPASQNVFTLDAGTVNFHDTALFTQAPTGASTLTIRSDGTFDFNGGVLMNVSTISPEPLSPSGVGTFTQDGGRFVVGVDGNLNTALATRALTTIDGDFVQNGGTLALDIFGNTVRTGGGESSVGSLGPFNPTGVDPATHTDSDLLWVKGNALLDGILDINTNGVSLNAWSWYDVIVASNHDMVGPNFELQGAGVYRIIEDPSTPDRWILQVSLPEPTGILLWSLLGVSGVMIYLRLRRK